MPQVSRLEARFAHQLSAAASQLGALRSKQEALGGALVGMVLQQSQAGTPTQQQQQGQQAGGVTGVRRAA